MRHLHLIRTSGMFMKFAGALGGLLLHAVVLLAFGASIYLSFALQHWWPVALILAALLPIEAAFLRRHTTSRGFKLPGRESQGGRGGGDAI